MSNSIVAEKAYIFATHIVWLYRALKNRKVERELLSQMLRSGTSISANLSEALYGNSSSDFLYRVRIALRECSETQMWLRLLHDVNSLPDNEYQPIQNECAELLKILSSIALTVQEQLSPKKH